MSLSSNLPSINKIAEVMGGDVAGTEALVPGPGHSAEDRSLAIRLDNAALDGFVVHIHATRIAGMVAALHRNLHGGGGDA